MKALAPRLAHIRTKGERMPKESQPEAEGWAGDSQSQRARGNLGPRDSTLHQTVGRLLVANHIFLEPER